MIRLILIGAAGHLLVTRPEHRDRLLGTARDALERLSARWMSAGTAPPRDMLVIPGGIPGVGPPLP